MGSDSGIAAHRRALGARGELLAARHLVGKGMVLLDHHWRCRVGEIDLVLRDGDVVVICEVKTRRSTAYGDPLEAVGRVKAARLRRLAALWLRDHDIRVPDVRIDLVGVLCPPDGTVVIDHVQGVG